MVDNIKGNLMISTQEKIQFVKKNSFRSNISKKDDTLANKTVRLTQKNGLIYVFKIILSMHEYVYKCAMVI